MGSRPSKSISSKRTLEDISTTEGLDERQIQVKNNNNTNLSTGHIDQSGTMESTVLKSSNSQPTETLNTDTPAPAAKQTKESDTGTDSQKTESKPPKVIPLTDEEADEKRESWFAKTEKNISTLNSIQLIPGESAPPETIQALKSVCHSYMGLRGASLKKQMEYKRDLGSRLNAAGIDKKICDIAVHMQRKGYRESDDDWNTYYYCILNSMNFSDSSASFTKTFAAHPDFLPHIRETLAKYREEFVSEADKTRRTFTTLKLILGIAHNTAMKDIDENIQRLREENFTENLMPYLKATNEFIILSTIATLAEIVDEKESELLQAEMSSIEFLVKRLRMALRSETRRSLGWCCHEIARAIGRLARNDVNKKALVDVGVIALLLELSKSEADTQEEEIKDAVQAIWALSFNEDNKLTIVNTEGLIDRILELKKNSNKTIKHACSGILWTLRDTLKGTSKYCDIATELFSSDKSPSHDKSSSEPEVYKQGHVMISYQWANQKTLIEVSSRLKTEKFPVWMDVDDMGGSTLQAMAEAIENAHLVLICMSQKYKDSPNCRAEAEYAFQKRKTIVPLIMEKGYRPDGWLGMILGSKLFYDFSGKYPFESKIGGLIKEVEKGYRPPSQADTVDGGPLAVKPITEKTERIIQPERAPVASAAPQSGTSDEKVKKWTEEEVKKWSRENKIERVNLKEIAGEELLAIRNVQHKAPEFFYRLLQEKLELSSVRDLFRFENALNNL